MQRSRIAVLSTILLGLALVSVPGAAASRSQEDVAGPFGMTVPGPNNSRASLPKAGEAPFDAQRVLTKSAELIVGAGTGGGASRLGEAAA